LLVLARVALGQEREESNPGHSHRLDDEQPDDRMIEPTLLGI